MRHNQGLHRNRLNSFAQTGICCYSMPMTITKTHRYSIGQSVRFSSGIVGRPGAGGTYKILHVLPNEGGENSYRIKSGSEPHERVARESQLERAS
jgi:hypothetical protein